MTRLNIYGCKTREPQAVYAYEVEPGEWLRGKEIKSVGRFDGRVRVIYTDNTEETFAMLDVVTTERRLLWVRVHNVQSRERRNFVPRRMRVGH